MSTIVPAILPTSYEDLEQKLSILEGLVDHVQIDIVDGKFVTPASWPYVAAGHTSFKDMQLPELPHLGILHYEMDLMVQDPEVVTGPWITTGAERLTVHIESTNYLPRVITDMQVKYGHAKEFAPGLLSLGLAINVGTELALLEPYLEFADYVQFMGIRTIGRQGQPFDERVLRKIITFRQKHPRTPIQVDGGVSLTTAPQLLSAGVDRLIIGSAVWKSPDVAEELTKFHDLVQEYGIYS